MAGSRTIKVLVSLVMAMTAGALVLKYSETSPQPLTAAELMALDPQTDYKTYVPVQTDQWKGIVIHSTGAEPAQIAQRVHFVVDSDESKPLVQPTELWRKQVAAEQGLSGRFRSYNDTTIAICLRGDFSNEAPSRAQMNALVNLVCTLQQMCRIGPQSVYMYSPDLSNGPRSPGSAFPTQEFNSLLRRLH